MDKFRPRPTPTHANARVSSSSSSPSILNNNYRNQLVGKNDKLPKIGSHSSYSSSLGILEQNQLSFDLGRGCTSGTPMKKLLADEMAKETESGRRSPNLIARLMGLDGLSASHNSSKKQKKVSDSHQRGSSSPGLSKNSKLHESRSHRKFVVGKKPLKDVYEVEDRSNFETRSNISSTTSNKSYHKDEIGFIRQKFMDAKRLSTDENLQHSKEFYDTIDVLNSNKDMLLRFLQEPDSLFSKHYHDLHGVPELNYVTRSQITGETSRKIDISHSHKHRPNCYSDLYDRSMLAGANESASLNQTKIVVLKPNLSKTLNITKSTPSISPSRIQSDKGSKDNASDTYGQKSHESRELAREITRRMKNKLGRDSLNFSSLGSKGYSADESSYDTSENESSYDSEVTFVRSWASSNRTLCSKSSSSRCMESSVNMEAKKRLSERWKMTHRSQEFFESSKGSTLAEMLAIPDVDIRAWSPDTNATQDASFCNFERKDQTEELFSPLGISSRDGWKGGYIQTLSRSRSLPNNANHFGSPKSISKCEAITTEKFLIRKENVGHVRKKAIKRDFRRKDRAFLENTKYNDGECQSYCSVEVVDDINAIDGKDSPEVKNVILETPSCRRDTCVTLNEEVPAEESCSWASPGKGSSEHDLPSLPQVGDSSCLQCTATHLESSGSSKESEQPSPNSVLEAPFVEDVSSGSECFERVSAELNGLRMQLQLLKQESEVYDEDTMLFSNDECANESTELYNDTYFTQLGESWESWYLVDVLALSGLNKIDCEFFRAAWHSSDCPIGPWVFDELEKRYNELQSCSRSERKLLYDNINARIIEIAQQFFNMEPWVKQGKNDESQWLKDWLKTELQKVIERPENKATESGSDIMILSKMGWMMLEEHISVVGRDIEALLVDELVSEIIHALY